MKEIITELQALAHAGKAYSESEFDTQRYERILQISALLVSLNYKHTYEEIFELFTKDKGYITPKIDVRGTVFKDNKILLVHEKSDGLWSLPGGWADINLSPVQNILKEMKEETGYSCEVIKLIGILDQNKSNTIFHPLWPHIYKIFFLCEITNEEPTDLCCEIEKVEWFSLNNIPPLSPERVTIEEVELCFKFLYDKNLPSFFE